MRDEFFDLINDRVLDDYLEQTAGQDAVDTVDLGTTTRVEYELLIDGLITAYNEALTNGSTSLAAIYYRHIRRLLEKDDAVRRKFEKRQNQRPSIGMVDITDIFGGGGESYR